MPNQISRRDLLKIATKSLVVLPAVSGLSAIVAGCNSPNAEASNPIEFVNISGVVNNERYSPAATEKNGESRSAYAFSMNTEYGPIAVSVAYSPDRTPEAFDAIISPGTRVEITVPDWEFHKNRQFYDVGSVRILPE